MKRLVTFVVMLFSYTAFAQNAASNVQLVNPPALAVPKGYSHAAIIDMGNCKMIIMAGQVAFDQSGNLVGKGDMAKQTEQVFRNIRSIVESAGRNMHHVVKLNYFVKDVSQVQAIRNVRDTFIDTKTPPASTLVEVSKLFRDDVLIEIEATAIIPK